MRSGEQMMRMTGKLCEPKAMTFTEDFRDYGWQAGVGVEVRISKYLYRNAITYNSPAQDARNKDLDEMAKNKLLGRFWRHIGAA
jgi:hypothetical protein